LKELINILVEILQTTAQVEVALSKRLKKSFLLDFQEAKPLLTIKYILGNQRYAARITRTDHVQL
jgi:hypothetical protein